MDDSTQAAEESGRESDSALEEKYPLLSGMREPLRTKLKHQKGYVCGTYVKIISTQSELMS
jgi:hypothetical protein